VAPDLVEEDLKQQARERAFREQQDHSRAVRLEHQAPPVTTRLPSEESPCFVIDRFELDGAESRRFRWALKAADAKGDRARGRCLGTAGINLVLERVHNAIVARGYVTTRVVVPEQDLSTGVLRLTLEPGRVGSVRLSDETARARWQTAFPLRPGDLLNLHQIEQALENLQRVPGVNAGMQLVPSESAQAATGSSDIVIDWQQHRRWHPQLWLDDGGSDASGRWQAGAMIAFGNLLGMNELISLSGGHTLLNGRGRGARNWSVQTSLPLGNWSWDAYLSDYRHHQTVAGAFEDYEYSGTGRQLDLRLGRLLWRSAHSKTSAHLRGWRRASDNFVDDVAIAVQRRRTGGWEVGLSQRRYWGRSTLDVDLSWRRGTGAFGALRAPEEAFGEGTSRSRRLLADARIGLPFQLGGRLLRYQASWRGQWNRTPLVSQEHFAIGGRYSVRGFDGDALLMGERGWLVRNDLGLPFAHRYEAYLGADYGRVGGARPAAQPGTELAGMVVGVRGCNATVYWDLFVGHPVLRPQGFVRNEPTFGVSLSSGLKRC